MDDLRTEEQRRQTIRNFYYAPKHDSNGETIRDGDNKVVNEEIPIMGFHDSYRAIAENFMTFVSADGERKLVFIPDYDNIIKNASVFRAILSERLDTDMRFKTSGFGLSREDLLNIFKYRTKEIRRIHGVPEEISGPKTFYPEFGVQPKQTGKLKELLEVFTFETTEDKHKFIAVMLSPFMSYRLDAQRPLMMMTSEGSSAGKTSTVETMIHCLNKGRKAIAFTFDEDNDSVGLSGTSGMANPYVLYDNIANLDPRKRLKLTKNVTDELIQSWEMGKSRTKIPNNKTWIATMNRAGDLDADLVNRSITIRMKDRSILPEGKQDEISARLRELKEEGDEILKDALYYVQQANLKDMKYKQRLKDLGIDIHSHVKFKEWSEMSALILHEMYPEEKSFDLGVRDDDYTQDSQATLLEEVLEYMLELNQGQMFKVTNQDLFCGRFKEVFATRDKTGGTIRQMNNTFKSHKHSFINVTLIKIPSQFVYTDTKLNSRDFNRVKHILDKDAPLSDTSIQSGYVICYKKDMKEAEKLAKKPRLIPDYNPIHESRITHPDVRKAMADEEKAENITPIKKPEKKPEPKQYQLQGSKYGAGGVEVDFDEEFLREETP